MSARRPAPATKFAVPPAVVRLKLAGAPPPKVSEEPAPEVCTTEAPDPTPQRPRGLRRPRPIAHEAQDAPLGRDRRGVVEPVRVIRRRAVEHQRGARIQGNGAGVLNAPTGPAQVQRAGKDSRAAAIGVRIREGECRTPAGGQVIQTRAGAVLIGVLGSAADAPRGRARPPSAVPARRVRAPSRPRHHRTGPTVSRDPR